jgi:two-component system, cell cycle response regulator
MVALAVAALGCAVLLAPVMEGTGGSWASLVTDLAYPLADVTLLALVAGTLAVSGWRPGRSWSLIGAALMGVAVADGLFLYQVTRGTYVEGGLLDALWPASTLMLGFAAWVAPERVAAVRLEGWRTLLIPSAFALLALGLLLVSEFRPIEPAAVALAAATLVAAILRMGVTFGENMRMVAGSRRDALTDALTGLWNRRKLMEDMGDLLDVVTPAEPLILIVLDLDGFKRYNDTFGHPAGDALLARLGQRLGTAVEQFGSAYRIGGDEFCALVRDSGLGVEAITAAAADGLSEHGEGFSITASHGSVLMPNEATNPDRALQIADQRLYGRKSSRQRSAAAQETRNALVQALQEREPGLRDHLDGVASLARSVGRAMGLSADDLDVLVRAAELHDVGKVAVPDSILNKPGELDDEEWGFVRQHTVVGERILGAAPALVPVAKLVRASHERHDGTGYPDGLSGEDIPLGARIVSVCDAYGAMTSDRPYGHCIPQEAAIDELRRCAGRQFDPQIVETFCRVVHAPGGALPEPVGERAVGTEVEVR